MKRAIPLLFAIVTGLLALGTVPAAAAEPGASWSQAKYCFNRGDYRCAYDAALMLNLEGRIVPGKGIDTPAGMVFLQMAFTEAAARAKPKDLAEIVQPVIRRFGHEAGRKPFLFGFAVLADADMCKGRGNTSCVEGFQSVYCQVKNELVPASWPTLQGVNPLSDRAKTYVRKVMASAPTCKSE
ncbi:hypothetical protein [Acidimangrovimonas sediminis]|uniref:hypothetical protein n=1 Tax=Acidimangrovimonas sediminis TaxID=2056283 RepID=UPI0011AED4B0|nr:hypothetical protein [Acidimangrovimonas sediminis]